MLLGPFHLVLGRSYAYIMSQDDWGPISGSKMCLMAKVPSNPVLGYAHKVHIPKKKKKVDFFPLLGVMAPASQSQYLGGF